MASLLDLYQSPGAPQSWQLAPIQENEANIGADSGEQQRRLQRDFTQYDLPGLVSDYASRGAFYSGGLTNAANRLYTQMVESGSDIARSTGYKLSQLAQNQVGATTGAGF